MEWDKLDLKIRNSESLNIFKKPLLNFIGPSGSTVFNCHNPKGVKLLIKLRLGLSNLRQHKPNIVLKIHLTQSAAVVIILKRQFISFFTVLIFHMKDKLF